MALNNQGYATFVTPKLEDNVLAEFAKLPLDIYTGGKQRYRKFSQFKLTHEGETWSIEKLPHRPFIQAKNYNGIVGGLPRYFKPIDFDPTPQVTAGVEVAEFDKLKTYQLNVHQVRVITSSDINGVTVPEGPHRDGHLYVMNIVIERKNISGGVSQLMPTGGGVPFFEKILLSNEAIIIKDADMWHNATNIEPEGEGTGFRDILIITFNEWDFRRYGEEFEKNMGLISSELIFPNE